MTSKKPLEQTKQKLIHMAEKIVPLMMEIRSLKNEFFGVIHKLSEADRRELIKDPEIQEIEIVLNNLLDQIINTEPYEDK